MPTAAADAGPCFYCPDLPDEGGKGRLAEEETHHASAARRVRIGDAIGLIDGCGTRASAVVESVEGRSLSFTVRERLHAPRPETQVVVASAVPKGERFRTLVDMLSQVGVAAIVPLTCERSTVKPRRAAVGRWRRVAIEACKQSRNPWIPELVGPQSVRGSLAGVTEADSLAYAEAGGGSLDALPAAPGKLHLYVGPEGGFSNAEKQLLAEHGGRAVGLGPNILRVETAAVVAAVLALRAPTSKVSFASSGFPTP